MSRGLLILFALLVASLAWAYALVNPFGGGASKSTVPVWKVEPRDIERLVYRKGATKITLEPRWEPGRESAYIWAQSESKPRARKRPGKPPPQSAEPIRVDSFKANSKANDILEKFANLEAKRGVGGLDTLKASDFGLPSLEHTIRLEFAEGREPLVLELGNATYGNHMRYATVSGAGRVYLFFENSFSRLDRARSILFDRELFPVSPIRASRLGISRGKQAKEMWRIGGQTEKGYWVYERDEAEGRPELMEFANALKNLKALEYLGRESGSTPEAAAAELEVLLYHAASGGQPTRVIFYRRGTAAFIARSSYSDATVRVAPRVAKSILEKGAELLNNP